MTATTTATTTTNTMSPATFSLKSFGIAITPDAARAYVSDNGVGRVRVLDLATNTAEGQSIAVGSRPVEIAIAADGGRAYVSNYASSTVSVVDVGANTVVGALADSGRRDRRRPGRGRPPRAGTVRSPDHLGRRGAGCRG